MVAHRHGFQEAPIFNRNCPAPSPTPQVNFGDAVRVVGNHESVGAWDAWAAPQLRWSDGDVWVAAVPIPEGTQLEYKLVWERSGGYLEWENTPNRTMQVEAAGEAQPTALMYLLSLWATIVSVTKFQHVGYQICAWKLMMCSCRWCPLP